MMSFFITFEGIEGSGKSTQIQLLRNHLITHGYRIVLTREPGGCPIADSIRSILLDPTNKGMVPRAEMLLYNAARVQHVAEVIDPALSDGSTVLCDRFFDATLAYQGGGRGMDTSLLEAMHQLTTENLTPDLTFLLDFPAELGLSRARTRNGENPANQEGRFELESLAFHERVRQGYLDLAAAQQRFRVIDATGEIEAVAGRILSAMDQFLAERCQS